ncbi:carbohydrate kinase family protein [Paenibacillus elgii]
MITVIGDLLADIIVSKGATNFATDTDGSIDICPGGQANNVAAWIAHEGVASRLIGKVGDDPFGIYLLDQAKKQGISCAVSVDPNAQTGKIVILVDRETGERSMIPDRGANLNLCESDIHGVEESDILYLSGYSFFEETTRKAIVAAKKTAISKGIPVALDPSSTHFLRICKDDFLRFLDGVTFLIPNYEEGVLLTGETDPHHILAALQELVPCPVLKLGADGCIFYENDVCVKLPAPKVTAVDVTGAGDSFIGSFLATYVTTKDMRKSVERAIEISSQVVTRIGARPC